MDQHELWHVHGWAWQRLDHLLQARAARPIVRAQALDAVGHALLALSDARLDRLGALQPSWDVALARRRTRRARARSTIGADAHALDWRACSGTTLGIPSTQGGLVGRRRADQGAL